MDATRRRLLFPSVAAALALALGACDIVTRPLEPLPTVRVTTDREEYAQGQDGTFDLVNLSEQAVEYNLCRRDVERYEGGRWTLAFSDPPATEPCAEEMLVLAPGARLSVEMRLPADLAPGRYRVRFQWIIRSKGDALPERERTTNPFEVVPAAPR